MNSGNLRYVVNLQSEKQFSKERWLQVSTDGSKHPAYLVSIKNIYIYDSFTKNVVDPAISRFLC